jgi:hypothetical protein
LGTNGDGWKPLFLQWVQVVRKLADFLDVPFTEEEESSVLLGDAYQPAG